jgi:hypothetical protein
MGLPAMDPLIRLAERANTAFDRFDKTEGDTLLIFAGMTANGTVFANPGHSSILL